MFAKAKELLAISLVAVPVWAAAQTTPPALNDGTGPWLTGPGAPDGALRALGRQFPVLIDELDAVLRESDTPKKRTAREAIRKARRVREMLQRFCQADDIRKVIQALDTIESTLIVALQASRAPVPPQRSFLTGSQKSALICADTTLSTAIKDSSLEEAAPSKEPGVTQFDAGLSNQQGHTFNFETLGLTTDEYINSSGELGVQGYLTGSFITEFAPGSSSPTTRFAGGLLAGDPSWFVVNAYYGSYVSPAIADGLAGANLRIFSGKGSGEASRRLSDFYAGGDLWLNGTVRCLTSSLNGLSGTAYEGQLTYALSKDVLGLYGKEDSLWTTTVSVSATYCSNHFLGLDEYALEVRTPIAKVPGPSESPIFFVAEYGTRGNYTGFFEVRL